MVHGKKGLVVVVSAILAVMILFTGCSGGSSSGKTPAAEEIANRIKETCSFDEMIKLEDSVLYNQYTDLNADIVADVAVYASTLVLADEICVIRVKSESDVDAALAAIDVRLADLKDKFTGYREEELPKVTNALIETRGTYILMTTTQDSETASKEFKSMVG